MPGKEGHLLVCTRFPGGYSKKVYCIPACIPRASCYPVSHQLLAYFLGLASQSLQTCGGQGGTCSWAPGGEEQPNCSLPALGCTPCIPTPCWRLPFSSLFFLKLRRRRVVAPRGSFESQRICIQPPQPSEGQKPSLLSFGQKPGAMIFWPLEGLRGPSEDPGCCAWLSPSLQKAV